MPRQIQIVLAPDKTDPLVSKIRGHAGVVGLRVQKGISLQPPGDVITVEITNHGRSKLMHLLDKEGIGRSDGSSVTTSEPSSLVSVSSAQELARDTSEASWEEMEMMTAKESNMTGGALLVMMTSGFLAAFGIATNALHIVIGAMVIAPGFEPLTRTALGIVTGSPAWRRGAWDSLRGYAALVAGAAVGTWVLGALGGDPLDSSGSGYEPTGALLSYWVQIQPSSLAISAAAGMAGALLIAYNRSVLTAGVMIALALVPAAAMCGMGLATQDWAIVGSGLRRLGIEAGLVVGISLVVLGLKQALQHRRRMAL